MLGIATGGATVILGGPHGRRFELLAGDVVVLPAGTGHCNAGSDAGLLVVGAYPNGSWDIRRGDPDERDEVLANILACRPRPGPRAGEGRAAGRALEPADLSFALPPSVAGWRPGQCTSDAGTWYR